MITCCCLGCLVMIPFMSILGLISLVEAVVEYVAERLRKSKCFK